MLEQQINFWAVMPATLIDFLGIWISLLRTRRDDSFDPSWLHLAKAVFCFYMQKSNSFNLILNLFLTCFILKRESLLGKNSLQLFLKFEKSILLIEQKDDAITFMKLFFVLFKDLVLEIILKLTFFILHFRLLFKKNFGSRWY